MVSRRTFAALLFTTLSMVPASSGNAAAAETDLWKTAGGLSVYLGVMPAEIVKGLPSASTTERPMHGGIPKGAHEYHFVAAVFDAASSARVSDAVVTAEGVRSRTIWQQKEAGADANRRHEDLQRLRRSTWT